MENTSRWSQIDVSDDDAPVTVSQAIETAPMAPAAEVSTVPAMTTEERIIAARNGVTPRLGQIRTEGFVNPTEVTRVPSVPLQQQLVVVAEDSAAAGSVVYWTLAGKTDFVKLKQSWLAEGLDEDLMPVAPSAKIALSRAVKIFVEKDLLVRKHPSGGWLLVDEVVQGDTLGYYTGAHIFLDENEKIIVKPSAVGANVDTISEMVNNAFNNILAELSTTDISSKLTEIVGDVLHAVPLRPTGGVYFCPQEGTATLTKVQKALADSTECVVFTIPAMRSQAFQTSILNALVNEITSKLTTLLNALNDESQGKRATKSRMAECDEISAKVKMYETMLSRSMGDLTARIAELRAKFNSRVDRFNLLEVD